MQKENLQIIQMKSTNVTIAIYIILLIKYCIKGKYDFRNRW